MKRWLVFTYLVFFAFPLWANPAISIDEQLSFVGMTLGELVERFGTPRIVFAARGNEPWQDDVVFQYAAGDFYIHRDRIWQVRFASIYGVSNGSRKPAVLRTLGDAADDMGDHVLLQITGRDWPLMLRVNFNNSGNVTAIYLYRPDF